MDYTFTPGTYRVRIKSILNESNSSREYEEYSNIYEFNRQGDRVDWLPKTWNYDLGLIRKDYIWSDGNNIYYSTNFQDSNYILNKNTRTWEKITFGGYTNPRTDGRDIWTDGSDIYYSEDRDSHCKFNKNNLTWEQININFDSDFDTFAFGADNIWTDGYNAYYSRDASQGIFDKTTNTWHKIYWNLPSRLLFDKKSIWTDGTNIYLSNYSYNLGYVHYVFDSTTKTWHEKNWYGLDNRDFTGSEVWRDHENNCYLTYWASGGHPYDFKSETHDGIVYKLNTDTSTWISIIVNNIPSILDPDYIWNDNENTYGSCVPGPPSTSWSYKTSVPRHYKINMASLSHVVEPISWHGGPYWPITGSYIWTDGENIYHSQDHEIPEAPGTYSASYVLNKNTNTWTYNPWYHYANEEYTCITLSGEDIWFYNNNID